VNNAGRIERQLQRILRANVNNILLKTSRPGKHFGKIEIKAFTEDKVICPVTVLKEYVARTLKNNFQLYF
jgi:hypothetical protein